MDKEFISIKMHPNAFEAFGAELVTNDIVALMELIKNSYDAFSYNVAIIFGYEKGNQYIEIVDDGAGMTRDVIENVWAVIATPYKRIHPTIERDQRIRRVSGSKGMGRFSAARLGHKLDIITKSKDEVCLHAFIDWKSIASSDSMSECGITLEEMLDKQCIPTETGTIIRISDLRRQWVESEFDELKESLSRLLSPFEEIKDFNIRLIIENRSGKESERETVTIIPPEFINHPPYRIVADVSSTGDVKWEYEFEKIRDNINKKSNGLIRWREIYEKILYKHRGVDNESKSHDMSASCGPFSLEIRVWDLDTDSRQDISETFDIKKSQIQGALRAYKGISVYRDGVLVLPKSETSRDWIGLDARRISDVGKRLSTSQMLGIVRIGADTNPEIKDTTDREKLVDTKENADFCAIIVATIMELENRRDMDREKKRNKTAIVDILSSLSPENLVHNSQAALASGGDAHTIVRMIQDYESEARSAIEDVKTRLLYYGQVATAGSMSSFILHEIRGGLTVIKRFMNKVADYVKTSDSKTKEYCDLAVHSHARMLMVANSFVPLYSAKFYNKKYICNLYKEVIVSKSFFDDAIKEQNLDFQVDIEQNILVALHPGEVQTIFVNLIDNAIYWIKQTGKKQGKLFIKAYAPTDMLGRISIAVSDDGLGIDQDYAEKIFEPGVTAKLGGVGMGLVIVTEILAKHQGKIAVQIPGDFSGATFVLDMPKA